MASKTRRSRSARRPPKTIEQQLATLPRKYDATLDVVLYRETFDVDDLNRIEASVRAYDKGEPRLQLCRYYRPDVFVPWRHMRLRRMGIEEGWRLLEIAMRVLMQAKNLPPARHAASCAKYDGHVCDCGKEST